MAILTEIAAIGKGSHRGLWQARHGTLTLRRRDSAVSKGEKQCAARGLMVRDARAKLALLTMRR
jgi:hypothetical protein